MEPTLVTARCHNFAMQTAAELIAISLVLHCLLLSYLQHIKVQYGHYAYHPESKMCLEKWIFTILNLILNMLHAYSNTTCLD